MLATPSSLLLGHRFAHRGPLAKFLEPVAKDLPVSPPTVIGKTEIQPTEGAADGDLADGDVTGQETGVGFRLDHVVSSFDAALLALRPGR